MVFKISNVQATHLVAGIHIEFVQGVVNSLFATNQGCPLAEACTHAQAHKGDVPCEHVCTFAGEHITILIVVINTTQLGQGTPLSTHTNFMNV